MINLLYNHINFIFKHLGFYKVTFINGVAHLNLHYFNFKVAKISTTKSYKNKHRNRSWVCK